MILHVYMHIDSTYLMEDDLQWKMTFNGKRPFMGDDCLWKMAFYGRPSFIEDRILWETTFDGRRHLTEDGLWWKTTFDGEQPLVEEDLWWKKIFDGRHPLMEDNFWRKSKILLLKNISTKKYYAPKGSLWIKKCHKKWKKSIIFLTLPPSPRISLDFFQFGKKWKFDDPPYQVFGSTLPQLV